MSVILGGASLVPGVYILLIGLNIVPAAGKVHAPLFVLVGAGIAFICGGVGAILQGLGVNPRSWINHVVGLGVLGGILTPFVWIVFLNNQVGAPTKLFFMFILGFIAFIVLVIAFARFIPGVKVISQNGESDFKSISQSDDKIL